MEIVKRYATPTVRDLGSLSELTKERDDFGSHEMEMMNMNMRMMRAMGRDD